MKRILTSWGDRTIILPIRKAIIEGVSADRLSVSLALGLTLGLIPVYGITTILVGIVALSLRLNFVTMQIAHFLVHPIQIALIIPFLKLGNTLFVKTNDVFSLQQYIYLFKTDFWAALKSLWIVNLSAVVVWFVLSIPLFLILLYFARFIIKKIHIRHSHSKV